MHWILQIKSVHSIIIASLLIDPFLSDWPVTAFHLNGRIPSVVRFVRPRRTEDRQQHRCEVRHQVPRAQTATRESLNPCNVTRIGEDSSSSSMTFAFNWNIGQLRQAVGELKSIYESRVGLTEGRHHDNISNTTRLPMSPRQHSRGSGQPDFGEIARDLRRYYVSINQAEEHERGLRNRRLDTLERQLCYVRSHMNNVLCALHAALEEVTEIDVIALDRLVRNLMEMRNIHDTGTVDVWVYLMFRDLEIYLQKMIEFVSSLAES